MTDREEMNRLERWKTRWRYFIGMYPEVLVVPLKLDREWLACEMAKRSLFHEKDDGLLDNAKEKP